MTAVDALSPASGATRLQIDFVSDLTCPWCAIGLTALERAIERLGGEVAVDLRLQPFELNPGIARGGEPIGAYAARKYGATPEQLAQRQALIRGRAAEVGLDFAVRTHVYATFDAHRLLHWAGLHDRQLALKHALLAAYHVRGENPALPEVLLAAAVEVGLDADQAREVIGSDAYAGDVRATVGHWQQIGIDAVPAIVIDARWLIEGGQPPDVIEQALRRIATQQARNG